MKRTILALTIVVLALTVLFGAAPAMAATGTTDGGKSAPAAEKNARLQNLLQREETVLAKQRERLEKVEQVIARTEEWIGELKEAGKDTAGLETALEAYRAALLEAEEYLDTAESVLTARAGFDSNGQVTDMKQALRTVKEAGKVERRFHVSLVKANADFRKAVRDYRGAER